MRHYRDDRDPAARISLRQFIVLLLSSLPFTVLAQDNYANDRAKIEDLMARYVIAMDWRDGEAYARTFTEDGSVVLSDGKFQGRPALAKLIEDLGAAEEEQDRKTETMDWRPRTRHFISNIAIRIDGNNATSTSYWTAIDNKIARHSGRVHSFGHYQDMLVKIDGEWLFKERIIYNESLQARKASFESPLNFLMGIKAAAKSSSEQQTHSKAEL